MSRRDFRYSWMTLRSSADIDSIATGRPSDDGGLRGLVGRLAQRLGAARAVAGGVDHDRHPVTVAAGREAVGEVLDRVDRLAVATDQEPDVVADVFGDQPIALDPDLDIGVDIGLVEDPLHQLADAVTRFIDRRHAHRLRPERFLRLRGGGGGLAPSVATSTNRP